MSVLQGFQSELWTAMPAAVKSYYPGSQSADLIPALKVRIRNSDGSTYWTTIPNLLDCPVQFPGGGGFTLSFPLSPGDEGLVVFSTKCIDAWWESGMNQDGSGQQCPDLRLHDLSDGFFIPRVCSKPKVPPNLSTDTCQLRSDDGDSYMELAGGHIINIVAPGGINIIGPTVFTGTVTANGHRIDQTHTHTGVTAGGGTSGPVS